VCTGTVILTIHGTSFFGLSAVKVMFLDSIKWEQGKILMCILSIKYRTVKSSIFGH
jgi:hypothetical protein